MMDTSKEYIKMCEKAEEIQAGHNQQMGDLQFDKSQDEAFVVESLSDLAENEPCYPHEVFLPRQDQLQEMVYRHEGSSDMVTVQNLCNFMLFVRPEIFSDGKYNLEHEMYVYTFKSMEQLWLAFVMKEKFNKVWTGEDWEGGE